LKLDENGAKQALVRLSGIFVQMRSSSFQVNPFMPSMLLKTTGYPGFTISTAVFRVIHDARHLGRDGQTELPGELSSDRKVVRPSPLAQDHRQRLRLLSRQVFG
jgi:hypothetical protein